MLVIRLSGVALRRGEREVLTHAALAVASGETMVVEGARGAGKSSLLAVAAGRIRPTAGAIWIADRQLTDLQPASLPYVRRNIGYLATAPVFDEDETVHENLLLALAVRGFDQAAADDEAAARMAEIGIADLGDRPVAGLSHAERKLCGVARALAGTPPLVVLDDPSTGIDDADRARLVNACERARAAGSALLIATSDAPFAIQLGALGASRVLLSDGKIVGATPHIAVVDDGNADSGVQAAEESGTMIDFAPRAARGAT